MTVITTNTDKILKIVELTPLDGFNTHSILCEKLKLRSNYKRLVGDLPSRIQNNTSDHQEQEMCV